jgi:hypothetical protein
MWFLFVVFFLIAWFYFEVHCRLLKRIATALEASNKHYACITDSLKTSNDQGKLVAVRLERIALVAENINNQLCTEQDEEID